MNAMNVSTLTVSEQNQASFNINLTGRSLLVTIVMAFLMAGLSSFTASAQLNHQWSWINGPDAIGQGGDYGTKGVPAKTNLPPERISGNTWTGPDGDLWLMGGQSYYGIHYSYSFNDLWKYDVSDNTWTWVKGSKKLTVEGTYGTKDNASDSNMPGSRMRAVTWTGPNGHLWLMGGYGYDTNGVQGYLNDLWRYNTSTNEWTWVGGADTVGTPGAYGTKGSPALSNEPGGRTGAISWVGPNGDLWLMGGYGIDNSGNEGLLNDLWRYDISTGRWTWVKGANTVDQSGDYGTQGIAASSNVPGARTRATAWTGPGGSLWLFGGDGLDSNGDQSELNDLWEFDISAGSWTWADGAKTIDQSGTYGVEDTPASANIPGARQGAVGWVGPAGDVWLMGGEGHDANGDLGELNDLWRLDMYTGNWTWIDGAKVRNQSGSYGTKGQASPSNTPGSRMYAHAWTGKQGSLYLMGGEGWDATGNYGDMNDLWKLSSKPAALSLDGSIDYAWVPDANALDVSNAMTMEFWVKFDDIYNSGDINIVSKGFVDETYAFTYDSNTDKLTFHLNTGSILNPYFEGVSLQNDTWYHIAGTFDGSTAALYINGLKIAGTSGSGSINTNNDPLYIGSGGDDVALVDGSMAEVRLWNTAKTEQEINDLMNLSVSGEEPDLAGYWLSRASGMHSVVDRSDNGNDLSLYYGSFEADVPPIKTGISGSEGWRFLGAPGDTTSYGELLDPIWTQGYTNSDGGTAPDPNVFYYDESNHNWQTPSDSSNIVGTSSNSANGTGEGTLVFVYQDDDPTASGVQGGFPKTLNLDAFGTLQEFTIPLSYTDTGVPGNDGWNLVSNPYPVAIYWQEIVSDDVNRNALDYAYIWDHSLNSGAGGYQVHYGEPQPPSLPDAEQFDGRIPAFQSFWVKAEGSDARLNIHPDHHVVNKELYKQNTESSPYLEMQMKGQDFRDAISVVFPSDEKNVRDDVPKLNSLSARHANLFIDGKNQQRWMAKYMEPGENGDHFTIPVDADISITGSFTLNWDLSTLPEGWTVELEEVTSGKRIDLRSADEHSFEVQDDSSAKKTALHQPRPPVPVGKAKSASEGDQPRFRLHISTTSTTGIADQSQVPDEVQLQQNYPNPFNPTTVIEYGVPEQSAVTLSVYNLLGQQVTTLVDEQKAAGSYEVSFNAAELNLSSGLYLYKLRAGSKEITRKMTLVK